MPKPWRVCTNPDCPELHQGSGRCPNCRGTAEQQRRPNGNPYASTGHARFRHAVLTRDPICTLCNIAIATVADHHPLERKELDRRGLNPNNPEYGRGLCTHCHNTHTAATNPAGWNRPT